MWITSGAQADWLCLLATTSDGKAHRNKSLIVVPTKTAGVTIGEKLDKLGMRASDTCPVYLDGVRVPQRHRIGEEGAGFTMQMVQFQEERLFAAASTLRGLENVIDATIAYARERKVFGKPLLDNQVVHFRFAELRTEVELLRSLTYRAVEEYVAGGEVTLLASMAKLEGGPPEPRGGRCLPAVLGRHGLHLGQHRHRAPFPRRPARLHRRRRRRGDAWDHREIHGDVAGKERLRGKAPALEVKPGPGDKHPSQARLSLRRGSHNRRELAGPARSLQLLTATRARRPVDGIAAVIAARTTSAPIHSGISSGQDHNSTDVAPATQKTCVSLGNFQPGVYNSSSACECTVFHEENKTLQHV